MVARRAIAAGAAAVLALSVLSGRGLAEDAAETCDQATLFTGTVAGVVGPLNPADWWRMPAVPGSYMVTLVSTGADLSVGGAGCGTICESANDLMPDRCIVRSNDGGLTIGVRSSSQTHAPYTVTAELIMPALTECSDRIDNDGDGIFDYPGDAGCSSPFDTVEDDSPCSPVGSVEVCHEIVTGSEVQRFQRDVPKDRRAHVAAYLRWYRFTVLGVPLFVPCVDVLHPAQARGCREAGGRPTGVEMELYDNSHEVADPTTYKNHVVRVCEATLYVSVAGKPAPPVGMFRTPC